MPIASSPLVAWQTDDHDLFASFYHDEAHDWLLLAHIRVLLVEIPVA